MVIRYFVSACSLFCHSFVTLFICLSLHGINIYLQLMRSCYDHPFPQDSGLPNGEPVSMFAFEQLEEAIVGEFIAGKPIIKSESFVRTVFQFKKEKTEIGSSPE